MRKLTATLCLTIAVLLGDMSEVYAKNDNKIKPLVEIINEARAGIETTESTLHLFSLIGIRCGGFFGAMAGLVGNKTLARLSMNMAQVTAVAEHLGTRTDLGDALKTAAELVMETKDRYRASMIDNNTLRGNYFRGDPLLDGDYKACKEVMPSMLDFVKRSGIPLYK
jgi:hypothetical protein